jgi:hypothetical protein
MGDLSISETMLHKLIVEAMEKRNPISSKDMRL